MEHDYNLKVFYYVAAGTVLCESMHNGIGTVIGVDASVIQEIAVGNMYEIGARKLVV